MAAEKGNKYALGNNGGRPPMYETPEELEIKCLEYFNYCIEEKEKATITGLTLYLGFSDRSSLKDYIDKEEFTHIVKRAKLTVEHSYEMSATTFDMFALKNMGWFDKQEIDHSSKDGSMTPTQLSPEAAKEISNKIDGAI